MSPRRETAMALYRARKLLKLEDVSPLTKLKIQEAFVCAAKEYHPDSRHKQPCARKFRECHEARRLLVDHYSSHTNVDFSAASDNGPSQKPWYKPSDPRDHGFPHTTLRVLTLKQNLALRGFVMATLALGAFCDKVVFS